MKNSIGLFLLIALVLIIEVSSVVNFKEYKSEENTITTNSYYDLFDLEVKCQNKGAIKNFVIRTNAGKIYYDYSCYSSLTEANENDESILKGAFKTETQTFKYQITESVESLKKVSISCPVDYALSRFTFSKNSNNYITAEYDCVGVKSAYQTKSNTITSGASLQGPSTSLEPLNGLTCGDNTIETDEIPGTPLRGFRFDVEMSGSTAKLKYYYSYHKLRSIENERKAWASKTKQFRDNNTQKN